MPFGQGTSFLQHHLCMAENNSSLLLWAFPALKSCGQSLWASATRVVSATRAPEEACPQGQSSCSGPSGRQEGEQPGDHGYQLTLWLQQGEGAAAAALSSAPLQPSSLQLPQSTAAAICPPDCRVPDEHGVCQLRLRGDRSPTHRASCLLLPSRDTASPGAALKPTEGPGQGNQPVQTHSGSAPCLAPRAEGSSDTSPSGRPPASRCSLSPSLPAERTLAAPALRACSGTAITRPLPSAGNVIPPPPPHASQPPSEMAGEPGRKQPPAEARRMRKVK